MDSPNNCTEQSLTPCVLMRGGTSKGLFFHEADVPLPGPRRDRFLKRVMGTPDALQIDGLGGSRVVTSKAAIICKSDRPDADVNYTFAQCDIERDVVGYHGNCGNISSGVGPFAIDEGLVVAVEPITTVRIYNTNTDKILVAKVQVLKGKARVKGDCAIAGVPGTGAEILMDYSGTVGAKTGHLLPTGSATDMILLEDGTRVETTICDVANPCVFFMAENLGLSGDEMPDSITADKALTARIAEIQAKAGQRIGMWDDWRTQHVLGLPLAVMVSPPGTYADVNGTVQDAVTMDMRARLIFLGKCHDSMAGTGSMCTAAASRVPGSVAHKAIGLMSAATQTLRIGHPIGVMEVKVVAEAGSDLAQPHFIALGLTRTARRLMAGSIYVPTDSDL